MNENEMKVINMRVFVILFAYLGYCSGFYVPGVAPVEFTKGSVVEVRAVKMTSSLTQLPYEYYSLQFCRPKNGTVYKTENFGEILRGDRIVNTAYDIHMDQNIPCQVLCNTKQSPLVWSEKDTKEAIYMINHDYYVHLIVDNLPCATTFDHLETGEPVYERGYRLGYVVDGNVYIYNHLNLIMSFHTEDNKNLKIVRFEVEAQSISHIDIQGKDRACSIPNKYAPQVLNPTGEFVLYLIKFVI